MGLETRHAGITGVLYKRLADSSRGQSLIAAQISKLCCTQGNVALKKFMLCLPGPAGSEPRSLAA